MANGLQRLDGVAEVEVDLQRNICILIPDSDRALSLTSVREAVRRAGFRPGRVFIEALGTYDQTMPGGLHFRIAGWPQLLRIEGATANDPAATTLTAQFVEAPIPHLVSAPWPNDE